MSNPRVLARMAARARSALTQSCNILSNSGSALNSAGGRNATLANWTPITVTAWSSGSTYSRGDTATGSDGKVYHSLSSFNTGNDPTTASAYWAQGFPCLVWRDKIFSVTQEMAGVSQDTSRFKAAVPLGTPVNSKMRIAVIGGSVFEIVGVDSNHANAVQIILDCKLIH